MDLRRKLPKGYAKIAAIQFNCSTSKVYQVAEGKMTSDTDMLLFLLDLAEKEQAKQNIVKEKMGKI